MPVTRTLVATGKIFIPNLTSHFFADLAYDDQADLQAWFGPLYQPVLSMAETFHRAMKLSGSF
jgi:hypothetical protein